MAIKGDDFIFYCYYDKSFCCFMRPMIRTSTSSPLVKCDGIIFKMCLGFVVFIELPQKAGLYSICRDVVKGQIISEQNCGVLHFPKQKTRTAKSPLMQNWVFRMGQIISEQNCGVLHFPKKQQNYCKGFCPSL